MSSAAAMIPLKLPHKNTALLGALIGLLISLPDAVITKSSAPVLGIGLVGGSIIGILVK